MGKKSGSGFGMNNPDHISESLETLFWGADPRWKKYRSGIRDAKFESGIQDKHPGAETLGIALNLFLFLTYCNVEIVAFSGAESGCIGNRYFLGSGANLPQPQIAVGY
jgi:hypothetical protein